MWSCDRSDSKNSGPIVHVLNGFYPESDVGRMSLNGLEQLVAALVRRTTEATARPKWWPPTIAYNRKINLGLRDEREIKLALKQLIVNCSQFFNKEAAPPETGRWSVGWNDENNLRRKRRTRAGVKKASLVRRSHPPLVKLTPIPFVRLERPVSPSNPTKNQFLHYFRLNPKRCKAASPSKPPPLGGTAKLTTCTQVPFSSDMGQMMATREQHRMSDDLKMKRLEKSEWYTNKEVPKTGEPGYERASSHREPSHCHFYKMPKRQFRQRRLSMHDPEFLLKFCTPVSVKLERLNLNKMKSGESNGEKRRRLMVMIGQSEKMCCDAKLVRTSPRLRIV